MSTILLALAALCACIWLPILVYHIAQRGFAVLLLWFLMAPIVLNVINYPGSNPLFGHREERQTVPVVPTQEAFGKRPTEYQNAYTANKPATFRMRELLEPTRTLIALFGVMFLLEALYTEKRLRLDRTELWMLLFVGLLVLSAVLKSQRLAVSLRIASDAFCVPFLGYYIMRRLVASEEHLRKLIIIMGCLGLCLILIALAERLSTSILLYRLSGPFETDNQFYVVLMTIFFMMIAETGRGLSTPSALPQGLRWGVICLVPLIILITWARSNWLGFLVSMWVFLFVARRLLPVSPKLAAIGLLLLLLPISVVGIQALPPGEAVEGRVGKTNSIYARFGAWFLVTREAIESPIFGIGFNNTRVVLATQRVRVSGVKNETATHNGFLSILAELGVVGLFVYSAIMVSIIRLGLHLYRTGPYPRDRWRGVCAVALLIAYLMPVLTTTILYSTSVCHIYVFACLGGIAGRYRGRRSGTEHLAVQTGAAGTQRTRLHPALP